MSQIIIDGKAFAVQFNKTIADTLQTLTDLGFTTDQLGMARAVQITVETGGIRYSDDATTDPTTAIGMFLAAGDELYITNTASIKAFRMIRNAAQSATVNVSLRK